MSEFKTGNFHLFPVNFHFSRGLAMQGHPKHSLRSQLDADHVIRRFVWEIELPSPLKQKHGVESVCVANFPNKDFNCWAGSTINDEEVFKFIKEVVE